jgi:hypothetical protein
MPNDVRFTAAATLRRRPSFRLSNSSRCRGKVDPLGARVSFLMVQVAASGRYGSMIDRARRNLSR